MIFKKLSLKLNIENIIKHKNYNKQQLHLKCESIMHYYKKNYRFIHY